MKRENAGIAPFHPPCWHGIPPTSNSYLMVSLNRKWERNIFFYLYILAKDTIGICQFLPNIVFQLAYPDMLIASDKLTGWLFSTSVSWHIGVSQVVCIEWEFGRRSCIIRAFGGCGEGWKLLWYSLVYDYWSAGSLIQCWQCCLILCHPIKAAVGRHGCQWRPG